MITYAHNKLLESFAWQPVLSSLRSVRWEIGMSPVSFFFTKMVFLATAKTCITSILSYQKLSLLQLHYLVHSWFMSIYSSGVVLSIFVVVIVNITVSRRKCLAAELWGARSQRINDLPKNGGPNTYSCPIYIICHPNPVDNYSLFA